MTEKWNGTTAANITTADVTMKRVLDIFEQIKLVERFEKLLRLAKKEGCLYVADGVASDLKDAGVIIPEGIELRECKWLDKGMMVAVDSGALDPFKAAANTNMKLFGDVIVNESIPHDVFLVVSNRRT